MSEIDDTKSEQFNLVQDPSDFLTDRLDSSRLVETGGDPETKERNARHLIFEDDEHGRWAVGPQYGRTTVYNSSLNGSAPHQQSDGESRWEMWGERHSWAADYLCRFQIVSDEEGAGFDGTGIVAAGCAFPSGSVGVEWLTESDDDMTVYPDVDTHDTYSSTGEAIEAFDGDSDLRVEWTDLPSIPPNYRRW